MSMLRFAKAARAARIYVEIEMGVYGPCGVWPNWSASRFCRACKCVEQTIVRDPTDYFWSHMGIKRASGLWALPAAPSNVFLSSDAVGDHTTESSEAWLRLRHVWKHSLAARHRVVDALANLQTRLLWISCRAGKLTGRPWRRVHHGLNVHRTVPAETCSCIRRMVVGETHALPVLWARMRARILSLNDIRLPRLRSTSPLRNTSSDAASAVSILQPMVARIRNASRHDDALLRCARDHSSSSFSM